MSTMVGGRDANARLSCTRLLSTLVVVGHLQASTAEAALDVEALVGLAAVEDALVAADLFGNEVQGLDDAQAQLLALLVLGHGDILNVADDAKVVDAVRNWDELDE